jgi:hypothetical protein
MISGFFVIAWGLGAAGGVNFTHGPAQSIVSPNNAPAKPVIVIQAYNDGLSGVRAVNPAVHLSVGRFLHFGRAGVDGGVPGPNR